MLYDFVMSREVFFIQDGKECLVIKCRAHCVYQKCRLSRRIVASSFVCPRTVKAFKLHCLCLPLCTFYCFLNALTTFMNFAPRKLHNGAFTIGRTFAFKVKMFNVYKKQGSLWVLHKPALKTDKCFQNGVRNLTTDKELSAVLRLYLETLLTYKPCVILNIFQSVK